MGYWGRMDFAIVAFANLALSVLLFFSTGSILAVMPVYVVVMCDAVSNVFVQGVWVGGCAEHG